MKAQINNSRFAITVLGMDFDRLEMSNIVIVAAANVAGQNVTLQPCGQTTRTLWIADEEARACGEAHFRRFRNGNPEEPIREGRDS